MEKNSKKNLNLNKNINNTKRKSIFKTILRCIEIVIIIICAFFAAIIVTQRVSSNNKAFLGFRLFRVETGSMIPKYLVGDVILVKEKEFDKIQVGDDVSYVASSGVVRGSIVTHQVVDFAVDENGEKALITKGIANSIEDPKVYENQVNGVVITKLQILSMICRGINNMYILYFLVIVPLTVYVFFNLLKANRKEYQK